MKKGLTATLIILGMVLVVIGAAFASHFLNKVPSNPEGTIGNTAGNLNNGGYFCEDSDGKVFFSNSYDNGALYSMNADETKINKLSSSAVSSLNTGGNYIYYYLEDSSAASGLGFVRRVIGVYRSKKNGNAVATLSREPADTLVLAGNQIYFQNYPNGKVWEFSKMTTEGKDLTVLEKNYINPSSVYGNYIYYNGMENEHFLYRYNMITHEKQLLLKYNVWQPVCTGEYVYFMDIENDYRLCRYSLASEEVEVVISDRLDCYNITDYYIYYQISDGDNSALMRSDLDGSNTEVVAYGTYRDLNATSQYLYFREFGNDIATYRTPVDGIVDVKEFNAAFEAIKKED